MKRIILFAWTLFGLPLTMAFSAQTATAVEKAATFKTMNVDELVKSMKTDKVVIFDSNSEKMFKDGHIPGATHMTFDKVSADKLPKDKAAKLVFYCANERCTASHDAARKAMELGYGDVWVLSPGIQGWKKAGQSIEK